MPIIINLFSLSKEIIFLLPDRIKGAK